MIISTRDPIKSKPTQEKLQEVNIKAKEAFDRKEFKTAISLFESIDLPKDLLPNLAKCYYYSKNASKALDLILPLDKDIELNIDYALYLNALGRHQEAFEIYKTLDQTYDKVLFNSGWHDLQNDNFTEGFRKLQYGAQLRAWGNEYSLLENLLINKQDRWTGEHCNHLALILEGGLGDQINFLRWAAYLKTKCDKLTLVCHLDLLRLLINAGYDAVPYINGLEYDKYVPAMSLPDILKIEYPTQYVKFPYIHTYEEPFIKKSMDIFAKNSKKIGIKWFGNPHFEHDQFRSLPKEKLKELSKYGKLFSFQFEDNDNDLLNLNAVITNWQDTYTVLKNLDYVVTSCTSIVHMAGAIGVKTYVLVPLMPYFVWASDNLKWYPDNVVIIRQKEYDNWDSAFDELHKHLESE